MTDKYKNFAELEQSETADEDYTILYRGLDSRLAVMAPHGGGIEPGTSDIADALAGGEFTFYAFKGLKKTGNKTLHISSNAFDEALGVKTSRTARIVISIHGSKDRTQTVQIGGRHQELKQKIREALNASGFHAELTDLPGLRGMSPENICNRCTSGKGVQLEIPRGLREKLFDQLDHRFLRRKTIRFYQFVDTLREALLNFKGRL
nr:poly-gamma-glutamate hydrolase family protein [Desulfobacula sp.]